jgi:hypothetical protein
MSGRDAEGLYKECYRAQRLPWGDKMAKAPTTLGAFDQFTYLQGAGLVTSGLCPI